MTQPGPTPAARHIHLDPLGGIAGDMFVAALLDAFPHFAAGAIAAATALAPVTCALKPHRDHALAGHRFTVSETGHTHHHHTHWADIRQSIAASTLTEAVKTRAIAIFQTLADAESRIHGEPADHIAFHEVGAADSIADIVAAAWLIDAVGPASWSTAALPLGAGTVETAHGRLPIPAPATALLLEGLPVHADGIPGERVTPTGAAIMRHLGCIPHPPGLRMAASGIGFGTRKLPGLSNCLRVLVFDTDATATTPTPHRTLLVVTFEIDDQSAEDLATGLDRIRATPGVHDALIMPAFGKKGRMTTHVQILADPRSEDDVVDACFAQTTTIGLRTQLVSARALPRTLTTATIDGRPIRLKTASRPGGTATTKAELDDLAPGETHAARTRLRRLAEHGAA